MSEKPKAHIEPMKRPRCKRCGCVRVKVTSTPINTDTALHRWLRCLKCSFAWLTIWD